MNNYKFWKIISRLKKVQAEEEYNQIISNYCSSSNDVLQLLSLYDKNYEKLYNKYCAIWIKNEQLLKISEDDFNFYITYLITRGSLVIKMLSSKTIPYIVNYKKNYKVSHLHAYFISLKNQLNY